jgi:hypothetical protein
MVLLTRDGPEHRYVAQRLAEAVPLDAIVVDGEARTKSLRRAFRGGAAAGCSRLALHAFRLAVRDSEAAERALVDVLGEATRSWPTGPRIVQVEGINSPEALAAVRTLAPDALLVYGTAIVGDEMLGLAADVALNMHTGISPHYRGTDCAFWPVVNRDPTRIGATVHECTPRADAGPVFAVSTADLTPDDGIHQLFARAVAAGAEAYADTARRYLAGDLRGDPQDLSVGREYRGHMRTLGPELQARWALRRGLLAGG